MDDNFKNALVKSYLENGESIFYKKLLANSIKKITFLLQDSNKKNFPHKELLDVSNFFLQAYRSEGDEIYLNICKICRKAAHKVYRVLLKKHLIKENNNFLNLV